MQNRRIIDGIFRSVGASPTPSVETNSIFNLVTHVSAGQWSAIAPRHLLRFFGVPKGTQAIELVEPVARRTLGLVMSDRNPPSPLARNLFEMPLPSDLATRIEPPGPPPETPGTLATAAR
jgi:DNA-binding transcriptional LysR family regulator